MNGQDREELEMMRQRQCVVVDEKEKRLSGRSKEKIKERAAEQSRRA